MLPNFYNPDKCGEIYLPRYELIAQEVWRLKNKFRRDTRNRTLLFNVDPQIGFCIPGASLYVRGAEHDNARLAAFVYRNMDELDAILNTLDTHVPYQIFFSGFWLGENGQHPAPYTTIKGNDISQGKWFAAGGKEDTAMAEAYTYALEGQGKYLLNIWPYHTMKGSMDHAVAPIVDEALKYFEFATGRPVLYIEKGTNAFSEHYSAFSPEIREVKVDNKRITLGKFDYDLMEMVLSYERVYIAGQAISHCVRYSMEDLIDYVAEAGLEKKYLQKFYILEDCTSSVIAPGADFPALSRQALKRFSEAGMNIVKSTDSVKR